MIPYAGYFLPLRFLSSIFLKPLLSATDEIAHVIRHKGVILANHVFCAPSFYWEHSGEFSTQSSDKLFLRNYLDSVFIYVTVHCIAADIFHSSSRLYTPNAYTLLTKLYSLY